MSGPRRHAIMGLLLVMCALTEHICESDEAEDATDHEARGGQPGPPPQRENGSTGARSAGGELVSGAEGLSQQGRQRESLCCYISQRSEKEREIHKTHNRSSFLQPKVQEDCVQSLPPHQRLHNTCIL
ncbi:hypothetical protein OJAV_G00229720 [Oryzias javanicus]|uniref:Uncharacterized protein n=1 Tax=Oryzias javanicus TaxID=123683 RepID=A0A3S2TUW0_ORYJA|nr:hypothetical protein OJAV_G00229720 [Oryzias javanicus]